MSSGMIFALIMVALIVFGRIVREGMKLEARKLERGSGRDVARLESENAQLRSKLGRLEDRMAVLERIATDAPARLSAQIDELR
jgi:hypothetical protein